MVLALFQPSGAYNFEVAVRLRKIYTSLLKIMPHLPPSTSFPLNQSLVLALKLYNVS